MTKTEIFNQALSRLGDATQIASDVENSPNAISLRAHYDRVRRSLLRDHPWNFAATRVSLTASVTTPAFGWKYQFDLPLACLCVRTYNGEKFGDSKNSFAVEGRVLLSNVTLCQLVYTKDETTIDTWDTQFIDAFTLSLAAACALDITHSLVKQTNLQAEAVAMLSGARFQDANEGKVRKLSPLTNKQRREEEYEFEDFPQIEILSRGASGWTPHFMLANDGGRQILRLYLWTGGEGSQPDTGYVGPVGLVDGAADAVLVKGDTGATGPIGPTGLTGAMGVAGGAGASWEHATAMLLMGG